MPAIVGFDDPYAWLLRGFVDAGLADGTVSGGTGPGGAVSAENLRPGASGSGIVLRYPGVEGGEYWEYRVAVMPSPTGTNVTTASPDTLFLHTWAVGPQLEIGRVAALAVAALQKHNAAFAAWRRQGGQVSPAESRSIAIARGVPPSRPFADWLDQHYRRGGTLDEGPRAGWWVPGAARGANVPTARMSPARPGQVMGPTVVPAPLVSMGQGQDPIYKVARGPAGSDAEIDAYRATLRTVGTAWMVLGGLGLCASFLLAALGGLNAFRHREALMLADLWPVLAAGLTMCSAALHAGCGWQVRSGKGRTFAKVVASLAFLPCVGGCWFVALPLGAWTWWVLVDRRGDAVFG